MKVYALFNDESALFERIAKLRGEIADASKNRPAGDATLARLAEFDGKLDGLRKKIVATKEGGAITGEERLREHTDQLYGAITSWDGPPSAYQLANTEALRGQLAQIDADFSRLTKSELPPLNGMLQGQGGRPLTVPPLTAFDDHDDVTGSGGGASAVRSDPDAVGARELPRNLRLWN
jgi:hypothetical protein